MPDPTASPAKILVVDDNEQNRQLALATLEEEGYHVLLARDGEEAITLFDRELPDCVLLDVKMPGTGGLDVCRRIRTREAGGDTPVVFLTALRDVDTFDEALRAGGDDFLTKPVRPSELVVRVQSALRLKRLTAENRGYYETVRQQRDALMRLQLQKEQLMDFVVHDLKNPVTSMDLHAQMLARDATLSQDGKHSVAAIREEARLLMRMIANLLDISKSESGTLLPSREEVNASTILKALVDAFEARARSKEVTVEQSAENATLRTDPDLLRRVLENLLDNAIRHAPQGSVVAVSASAIDGCVELRVTDRGRGVPDALREKVFERFVQLGTNRGQRVGYGLGLAFCKLAVELLSGQIWVEDAAPGAVFCVKLPRSE